MPVQHMYVNVNEQTNKQNHRMSDTKEMEELFKKK